MDLRDAYRILNLPYGSDYATCHSKYKKLALQFHPDLKQHLSETEKIQAHETFVLINQAWRVLRSAFGSKDSSGIVPVPEWEKISVAKTKTTKPKVSRPINYETNTYISSTTKHKEEIESFTTELWENWSTQELFNIALDMIKTGRASRVKYLPDKLIEYSVEKLQSNNSKIRNKAIKVLVAFGNKVAPILMGFLTDTRGYVRANAVLGLGELNYQQAAPIIIEMLDDTNLKVRQNAARALGLLGDRNAIEPLKYLILNERFKIVVWTAALALLRLVQFDEDQEELRAILRNLVSKFDEPKKRD